PTSTLFPYTTLFRSGSEVAPATRHALPPVGATGARLARRAGAPGVARRAALTPAAAARRVRSGSPGQGLVAAVADEARVFAPLRSEEHTSELQSLAY